VTLFFIAVAAVAGITITLKKQWQHNNACVTGDTGVSKSATAGVVASIIVQGEHECFVSTSRFFQRY